MLSHVSYIVAGAQGDDGGEVRHAETPELAQEALIDAVILIFKAQVGTQPARKCHEQQRAQLLSVWNMP